MEEQRAGRELCGDLDAAESREWLVTNGRGGYASGTVAGSLTRRYHGLLVAALAPPVERRLLVAKCEIDVEYDGCSYALGTNRWASGEVAPHGYRWCESFAVVDGVPTWTFACGDATIEQTIAMPYDRDATAVGLRVVRAREPVRFTLRILVADRDHHGGALPDAGAFVVACRTGSATIEMPFCHRTVAVGAAGGAFAPAGQIYRDFALPREAERGLQSVDSYVDAVHVRFELAPGADGGCVVALDAGGGDDAPAIVASVRAAHRARVASQRTPLLGRLATAADAFIVRRGSGPNAGKTIIAGYHWFADWGRDTMIALPGLLLHTGRPEVARDILSTFAASIDGGMIPNRFPDDGTAPEYNTVDASLWFIEAVRAYVAQTGDAVFLHDIFPALDAIVDGYVNGTRYGIGVDADGLVRAGVPGVQLTWMDAKVGDLVVTPRSGKPIEISALWYAAMRALEVLAPAVGRPGRRYATLAERCKTGFERFWNADAGYCYDVLDGPAGNDPALRPNQLFAAALHVSALDVRRTRAVVDACARELLTSYGLRTLAPSDPAYRGRYGGDAFARDGAYHQGTVWPWLLGPFVRAHLAAYGDPATARTFVAPLADALNGYGLGSLGEIFEGDAPHAARGAIAQAWSVAEFISTLALLESTADAAPVFGASG